jgi:hypothetical protein
MKILKFYLKMSLFSRAAESAVISKNFPQGRFFPQQFLQNVTNFSPNGMGAGGYILHLCFLDT